MGFVDDDMVIDTVIRAIERAECMDGLKGHIDEMNERVEVNSGRIITLEWDGFQRMMMMHIVDE